VSSSSSGTDSGAKRGLGPVARLLVEALEAMRREVPDCYRAARGVLAGRRARCRIEGETFVAAFGPREITVSRAPAAAGEDVDVNLSRRTILALIRNEQSLHAAVLRRDLEVRGTMANVSDLGRSMKAFLHGAVRSPSLPGIYARFERLTKANVEPARDA